MLVKKIFWYLPRVLSFVVALAGISSFFVYSDIIGRSFQSVVGLKSAPSFGGGRIASVIYDPVGDDHGYGSLVYPLHRNFVPGSLDLVRYTVHEPVYAAQWSNLPEYWQLDLSFSAGLQAVRNIRIYIDVDGDVSGSTHSLDDMAEGVSFDPAHPWNYVLSVQGNAGLLESADGKLSVPLSVLVASSGREVSIRIPLRERVLQKLYMVEKTYHYVCIGGWTPWGRDGFIPVGLHAASGTGGGAPSSLTPKLYDYLAPIGKSQEEMLSDWNDETLSVPVLYPVEVEMHPVTDTKTSAASIALRKNAASIAELENQVKAETDSARQQDLAVLANTLGASTSADEKTKSVKDLADIGLLYFNAGKRIEAESVYDRILVVQPENACALAYKGVLVAKRGGDAPPLAAVDIVADAYRYLDRAVLVARTSDEVLTARLSRANVSKSVPDTVFGKALQGAEDFLSAAAEYRKLSAEDSMQDKSLGLPSGFSHIAGLADAYLNAALCYEIAGRQAEAGTWFREAARLVASADQAGRKKGVAAGSISSAIRLELLRHEIAIE